MTPYYPQSESKGGWRSVHHNRKAIADLGLDQVKLDEFVQWNLSIQCDPPTQVGFMVIKNG
ncbi:hypothetical protein [Paenibacillus sp. RC67]|uniref:hypothetical protein n=1 Tax=Paenibacillus sp. RC67 TaxID=3039392 RepID=UPI0024AD7262|nr:hypothetical protein [Paenibacillus sp. RC67]